MKYSLTKLSVSCIVAAAFILPATSWAEGDGKQDWAEKAATEYEQKAQATMKSGNEKDALIYLRMAQIKRDAGIAAKAGQPFSWDEYHQLSGMLQHAGKPDGKKEDAHKGKPDARKDREDARKARADARKDKAQDPKKGGDKKPDWEDKPKDKPKPGSSDKKSKERASSAHLKDSEKYEQNGLAALKAGDTQKAMSYVELALIKRQAAVAAEHGLDFDWTRYHEVKKQLGK